MAEWRPIPGFPAYEASTAGDIRRAGAARLLRAWPSGREGYLQVNLSIAGKVSRHFVHRLVALTFHGPPQGRLVDHLDGARRNNAAINLRYADQQQNAANCARKGGSSRFRGITWDRKRGKWAAYVGDRRRTVALGRFEREEDAARAYDAAARRLYGAFARLNFPAAAGQGG